MADQVIYFLQAVAPTTPVPPFALQERTAAAASLMTSQSRLRRSITHKVCLFRSSGTRLTDHLSSPFYSQCVAKETSSPVDTKTITTTITVPGPKPTTITTYITVVTPKPPKPTKSSSSDVYVTVTKTVTETDW